MWSEDKITRYRSYIGLASTIMISSIALIIFMYVLSWIFLVDETVTDTLLSRPITQLTIGEVCVIILVIVFFNKI